MRRRVYGHSQSDDLSSAILFRTIIQPLLELDQNRSKLKLYIGHLTALCHDRDPLILRGLTPPASYNLDDDQATWKNELQKMTQEQLQNELEKGERDNAELQEFANAILQQIADHCPDILEQVVNALEESSWPRFMGSCQPSSPNSEPKKRSQEKRAMRNRHPEPSWHQTNTTNSILPWLVFQVWFQHHFYYICHLTLPFYFGYCVYTYFLDVQGG